MPTADRRAPSHSLTISQMSDSDESDESVGSSYSLQPVFDDDDGGLDTLPVLTTPKTILTSSATTTTTTNATTPTTPTTPTPTTTTTTTTHSSPSVSTTAPLLITTTKRKGGNKADHGNKNNDAIQSVVTLFQSCVPPNQWKFLFESLTNSARIYQDGELIETEEDGTITFVVSGEMTVTEFGRDVRSGSRGDAFGHVSHFSIPPFQKHQSQRKMISSRDQTRVAFLSPALITQHVPLLPAMLLLRETQWLHELDFPSVSCVSKNVVSTTCFNYHHIIYI